MSAEALFAADVNHDGLTDGNDIEYLSNALLGKGSPLAWEAAAVEN